MDLHAIHNLLLFYLDKEGTYFSHEELDSVLDRAQIQFFDAVKPAYGQNQSVHDALLPFKKEQSFTNSTSPGGLVTLNADYLHLLAVETVVVDSGRTLYVPVEVVGEDEVSLRKSSQLIPLSVKTPVGLLKTGRTFQIYPAQASAGTVYYLRRPVAPEYKYTQSGRTITYNSDTSVQLEWNEGATEKIILKALQLLGLPIQDVNAIQFAGAKEAQG